MISAARSLCPSNVKIGDIIQSARLKYSKTPVKLRDIMLASTDVMGTVATRMAPVVNGSLRLPAVKKLLDLTLAIDSHRTISGLCVKDICPLV